MPFAACRRSASPRPNRLGTNRSVSIASSTRSRVSAATGPLSRITLDTVVIDTPACAATW
jgi:hypothetical protein